MVERNYEFEMDGTAILDSDGDFQDGVTQLFSGVLHNVCSVLSDNFTCAVVFVEGEPFVSDRDFTQRVVLKFGGSNNVEYLFNLDVSIVTNAGHVIVSILDETDDSDPCLAPSFHNDRIDFFKCLYAYVMDCFLAILTDVISVHYTNA